MKEQSIIISANFTIDSIVSGLTHFLDKLGIANKITFTSYNQIFQELLNPSSLFYLNRQGVNVVFLKIEDLIDLKSANFEVTEKELEQINKNAVDLTKCFQNAENFTVPLFVFLCPRSNFLKCDEQVYFSLNNIEKTLAENIKRIPNVYVFETELLAEQYLAENIDNPKGNLLGHIPYTQDYFLILGAFLARKIDALNRNPYKVIVFDCDNTLWKGICGEDGVDGIEFIDPLLCLHKLAIEQSEAGMVICLCSKNNENDVWEVFDNRKEVLLKREHIVSWRINWELKSRNLKSLAEELNLGLDSFIFIDDDAAVCAEVTANCPEVLTIQLPEDLNELPRLLEHIWVFDKLKITKEDKERTKSYQQQISRQKIQMDSMDFNDFLNSLQLICEISDIREEQIPRVSQLSLRTNQFNSTSIRRSESDLRKLIENEDFTIWTVIVTDRFGDYGLVGTVIFDSKNNVCEVDSFILSCRALGRGVEYKIVEALAKKAQSSGTEFINFHFIPSAKNAPILKFFNEIGEAHKNAESEKIVYSIPTKEALKVKPQNLIPKIEQTQTTKAKDEQKVKTNYSQISNYLEIAKQLNTVQAIYSSLNKSESNRPNLTNQYIAPQDEIEKEVAAIWEKLLNVKNIGTSDDFFKLGGDSLTAVSLFVEIEEKFGKSLPLSTLITSPTVAEICRNIKEESRSAWKYLVPIQKNGKKPPIFCMHAAGGNVLFYRDLANELGTDHPVYGLQARGIADKNETAHDRIEDMAREYLEEIRSLQPEEPYQLCGSSFGGLVAFETALQLQAAGKRVSILALFDTYAPGYPVKRPNLYPFQYEINDFIDKTKNGIRQLGEVETFSNKLDLIFAKAGKLRMRSKRKFLWKKNEFAAKYNKVTGRELPKDVQRNHKAIQTALKNYQPQIYRGQLILFRAAQQPSNFIFDEFLGWKKFTDHDILTEDVLGSHGAVTIYPFATDLAEKFKRHLTKTTILSNKQPSSVEV